eukprot:1032604-Pyramimonas_sp.AAC.1
MGSSSTDGERAVSKMRLSLWRRAQLRGWRAGGFQHVCLDLAPALVPRTLVLGICNRFTG